MANDISVKTPDQLQSILIAAAVGVVDGRITVQQANALSGLSSEVHKSIKMQFVGQMIGDGSIRVENGRLTKLLDA